MEQLVILILIGLISLINWLVQKSGEMREKRKLERQTQFEGADELRQAPPVEDSPFVPPSDQDVQAEKLRRFMEALGMPVEEEAPPPRPRPVRQATPPPFEAFTPAPGVVVPASLVTAAAEVPPARSLRRTVAAAPVIKKEPSRVRRLLSNGHGLRDAIVVSEVLGPPRGLQKF